MKAEIDVQGAVDYLDILIALTAYECMLARPWLHIHDVDAIVQTLVVCWILS